LNKQDGRLQAAPNWLGHDSLAGFCCSRYTAAMSQNATDADVVMHITISGPAYQILADFADQLDTTPEDMAELATNMLCQFEELREFAAGLVAGVGAGVGAE
jgi:hypothetical protein